MKNLLTALLLLLSLSGLSQSVTVGPVVRRPALAGTYNITRNGVTGLLELTPKVGSPFLVAVDTAQVRNWNGIRRTFKPHNYRPTIDSVTGLSARFVTVETSIATKAETATVNATTTAINTTINILRDTVNTKASKAEVSRILSGTASADASAYSRTSTDFLLAQKASEVSTATRLLAKTDVLSIAALRTGSTLARSVLITDQGREGRFDLDLADTTTPDDSAMTLRSGNLRYKRIYPGPINPEWFGAIGDGLDATANSNRIAINKAMDYAVLANNPGPEGLNPTSKRRPNHLHFPAGSFWIKNGPVRIGGAVRITGEPGLSFGGTRLFQASSGQDLFEISGHLSGGNVAVQIEDLRLSALGSGTPLRSLIYSDFTGSKNSLYFFRIWFQGWEKYAVQIQKADDVKILDCIFDGATNQVAAFGRAFDSTSQVSNLIFSRNTLYDVRGGGIDLKWVKGATFANNHAFKAAGQPNVPYFLDALADCGRAEGIKLTGNFFNGYDGIFRSRHDAAIITDNHILNARSRVFDFGGGGIVRHHRIADNIITGVWSRTLNIGTAGSPVIVPDAPITAYGTGLQNNTFKNDIYDNTAGSVVPYYVMDARSSNNTFENDINGFSQPTGNLTNPEFNLVDRNLYLRRALSFTTAVIGGAGLNMAAKDVIAADIALTGAVAGDLISYVRVGGQSAVPIGFRVQFLCLEANQVRIYIENTTGAAATYPGSAYALKLSRSY